VIEPRLRAVVGEFARLLVAGRVALHWRGRQIVLDALLVRQSNGMKLGFELGKRQIPERLDLPRHAHRHLPAGGIEVGEVQHHEGTPVLCGPLDHLGHQGRGELATRQDQLATDRLGYRQENIRQGRLLADQHDPVALAGLLPA
jgi:hypothetical protein